MARPNRSRPRETVGTAARGRQVGDSMVGLQAVGIDVSPVVGARGWSAGVAEVGCDVKKNEEKEDFYGLSLGGKSHLYKK